MKSFSHRMESTDLVSLLRIYATAKREFFQRKRKRSTARAVTSRKEENESPLDPGPKIQISKYVSSADDVYLSQFWDLVSAKFRALKKHWPGLDNSKLFSPKIWTCGCVTKRGGAWQKSVWEPELADSDWFLFKEIAVLIFWTDKVTSDNNIGKSPICKWNSWMVTIYDFAWFLYDHTCAICLILNAIHITPKNL